MHHQPTPEPHFTYGDYLRWTGDERWELIDGEAFSMSPAPSRQHQEVVGALYLQIASFLRGHPCRAYVAPFDVRLPRAGEADSEIETVVQPDLVVVCDPTKLDDAGCRGAPDWVIEVLSPQTAARDRLQKREIYERHGVREYWLVDPTNATVTLFRQIPNATGQPIFGTPVPFIAQGRTVSGVLPGLEIQWGDVFSSLMSSPA